MIVATVAAKIPVKLAWDRRRCPDGDRCPYSVTCAGDFVRNPSIVTHNFRLSTKPGEIATIEKVRFERAPFNRRYIRATSAGAVKPPRSRPRTRSSKKKRSACPSRRACRTQGNQPTPSQSPYSQVQCCWCGVSGWRRNFGQHTTASCAPRTLHLTNPATRIHVMTAEKPCVGRHQQRPSQLNRSKDGASQSERVQQA